MIFFHIWLQVSFAVASAAEDAAGARGTKRPHEATNATNGPVASPKAKAVLLEKKSPVSLPKAIKNAAELAGMREAHLRDAVAICDFLQWIEKEVCYWFEYKQNKY